MTAFCGLLPGGSPLLLQQQREFHATHHSDNVQLPHAADSESASILYKLKPVIRFLILVVASCHRLSNGCPVETKGKDIDNVFRLFQVSVVAGSIAELRLTHVSTLMSAEGMSAVFTA